MNITSLCTDVVGYWVDAVCCSAIRQSLISSCKFEAALLVCNKYQLDRAGVYASWGLSELSRGGQEHFELAKDKFKHYYQVWLHCSATDSNDSHTWNGLAAIFLVNIR